MRWYGNAEGCGLATAFLSGIGLGERYCAGSACWISSLMEYEIFTHLFTCLSETVV